jgi:hypothetical protein
MSRELTEKKKELKKNMTNSIKNVDSPIKKATKINEKFKKTDKEKMENILSKQKLNETDKSWIRKKFENMNQIIPEMLISLEKAKNEFEKNDNEYEKILQNLLQLLKTLTVTNLSLSRNYSSPLMMNDDSIVNNTTRPFIKSN